MVDSPAMQLAMQLSSSCRLTTSIRVTTLIVTTAALLAAIGCGGSSSPTAPTANAGRSISLAALTIPSAEVTGGSSVQGQVVLSAAAPAGGSVVTLASSGAVVTVPASVRVAEAATSALFVVSTGAVASDARVTISATAGGVTRTAALEVSADEVGDSPIASVSIDPSVIVGGTATRGMVTLNAPAGPGGTSIALSSDDTAARVPTVLSVAAGADRAAFAISTSAVPADVQVRIGATLNGVRRTALLRLTPVSALAAITFDATEMRGGEAVTGMVRLSSAARGAGTVVDLHSNSVDAVVPARITVPRGAASAEFAIDTRGVSAATEVTITASAAGDTVSRMLRLLPGTITAAAPPGSQTFAFSGLQQQFTVPAGVAEITVTLDGAAGGPGFGSVAGLGGRLTVTVPVTAGEVLAVNVGGVGAAAAPAVGPTAGGFNGGGDSTGDGGGGGGASDLRRGGTLLAVAGGGGGGGTPTGGSGGAGGGLVGGNGTAGAGGAGLGGSQVAGGAGGAAAGGGSSAGTAGGVGTGGSGGEQGATNQFGAGGGGGGYFGGGGGGGGTASGGGGGGGSSYAAPGLTGVTHGQGVRAGSGQVVITW